MPIVSHYERRKSVLNRKLGALLLSVLAVLFAAASAFSFTVDDLNVDEDSDFASQTLTEGYNYKTRILAYTDYDDDNNPIPMAASWDVTPLDWIKWWVSDDKSLIIEGVLPDYSDDDEANTYTIHAVAHVSGDIDTGEYDDDGNPIYVSGDISMDVGWGSGLELTVEEDTTRVSLFSLEMVSVDYDSSRVENIDTVGTEYSVLLTFKTSVDVVPVYSRDEDGNIVYDDDGNPVTTGEFKDGSTYVILQLDYSDPEYFREYVNLPSWLSYEVVSSQDSITYNEDSDEYENDGNTYVKELRVFYKSDHEPEEGAKGSVRITGGQLDTTYVDFKDPEYTGKYDYEPTVGWGELVFVPIKRISLDHEAAAIAVKYGSSADLTVIYANQHPADTDGVTFTPDISGNVSLDVSIVSADSDEPSGIITITATPKTLADAVYSTDMIVTDTNGKTATMRLTVSVDVPSIQLSEDTVSILAAYGDSPALRSVAYTGPKPTGWQLSKEISDDFGLMITSDDAEITITMGTMVSGDWSGTLTILDEYKKSADIALTLKCVVSGDMNFGASGDIWPDEVVITEGKTTSYSLNIGNFYGNVNWSVSGTYPAGAITPLTGTGEEFTFWINALAGTARETYDTVITVTDDSGRSAEYTFTWTVKPHIAISGDFDPKPLTVVWGESADAAVAFIDALPKSGDYWFTSEDISADVSFDVSWTSSDNSGRIEGLFTVRATPITPASKDYTATFFFLDSEDNAVSAELTVKVRLPEPFEAETSPDTHMDTPLVIKVGESADVVFTAKNFAGNVSWSIISHDSLKFEPKTGSGYATRYNEVVVYTVTALKETGSAVMNMVFASDDAGRVDEDNLYIAVPLSFFVEPSVQTVQVSAGGASKTVSFTASGDAASGVTWTVGTAPDGVTVVSDGSGKFTVTAASTAAAATNTVDITAANADGKTAEAGLVVSVIEGMSINFSGDKIPDSGLITYGGASSYTLTTDSDSAKWTITGENIADIISSPLEGTGSLFAFTVNPKTGALGTYTGTVNVEDETSGKSGSYAFTVIVKAHIALSYDIDTISVVYGSSADLAVDYENQFPADSGITFSPDISADVTLTAVQVPSSYENPRGTITVHAVPVKPYEKLYSTDMIVTDIEGYSASMTLYVSVDVGELTVTPASASVRVLVGQSRDVSFTAANHSGVVSWDIGTVPAGITVVPSATPHATEYNTVGLFTVTGVKAGTYSVDITATDERNETAAATVYVSVLGTPPIPPVIEISPDKASVSVAAGASGNVTFTASAHSGDVSWTLGTVPSGITVTPATQSGTTAAFTVTGTAAGTYSVDVVAEDSTGARHATINATVTAGPTPGTFTITASSSSLNIVRGNSAAVTFTASNNSGDVRTWSADVVSGTASGLTVTRTSGGSFTVTGNTAGSYSVRVTATDAANRRATAAVSVTVTDPAATLPVSPSTATVSVAAGSSSNASFTVSNNSGNVTWTLGTVPAGVTVAPATNVEYATQYNTRMVYTVTGVTAGTYSVTVTARDTANKTGTATISITVTGSSSGGKITTPSFSLTDSVTSRLRNALSRSGAEVATLPEGASSGSVSSVGTTVYLPAIVVEAAKIYVFGVSPDNLPIGYILAWTPNASDTTTGEYVEASDAEKNAAFLDDSGNEITAVPANRHVNVAAYFEPGKTYEPTITATSGSTSGDVRGVGGASGGCSAGLGALVSAIAAAFFIGKKRS